MKRKSYLLVVLLGVSLCACQSHFTIEGTIPNANKKDTLYLVGYGRALPIVEEIEVKRGKFKCKIKDDSVEYFSLFSPKYAKSLWFIPFPKKGCKVKIEDWEEGILTIRGDKRMEEYYAFRKDFFSLCKERGVLQDSLSSLIESDSLTLYQSIKEKDTFRTIDKALEDRVSEFILLDSLSPYNALAISDFRSVTHRYKPFYGIVRKLSLNGFAPKSLYHTLLKEQQKAAYSMRDKKITNFELLPLEDWKHNLSYYTHRSSLLLCFCDVGEKYSCYVISQLLRMSQKQKEKKFNLLFVDPLRTKEELKERVDSMKWEGVFAVLLPEEKVDISYFFGVRELPDLFYIAQDERVVFHSHFLQSMCDSITIPSKEEIETDF